MTLSDQLTQLTNLSVAIIPDRKESRLNNPILKSVDAVDEQRILHTASTRSTKTEPHLSVDRIRNAVEQRSFNQLLSVVVAAQYPIAEKQRQILISQTFNNPTVATLLKQASPLFLLKLINNGKAQWAISQRPIPLNDALNITTLSKHQWFVQSLKSKPQPELTIKESNRLQLPIAKELAPSIKTLFELQQTIKFDTQDKANLSLHLALHQLKQTLPSSNQLSNPKLLQSFLKNSGLFLENKLTEPPQTPSNTAGKQKASNEQLSQLITTTKPIRISSKYIEKALPSKLNYEKSQQTINNVQRLVGSKLLGQILGLSSRKKPLQLARGQIATEPKPNVTPKINNTLLPALLKQGDLKAQLLIIKELASQILNSANKREATSKDLLLQNQQETTSKIGPLLDKSSRSTKSVDQNHLIQKIQQTAMASLAKIQLNQTSSVNTAADSRTGGNNPLFIELPIRHGDSLHSLHIQFEESWEREDEADTAERKQVKKWQVQFTLELPEEGNFYSRIIHCNGKTEVTVWAEQAKLMNKLKNSVAELHQRLIKKGIDVDRCEIEVSSPKHWAASIQSGLVDITL